MVETAKITVYESQNATTAARVVDQYGEPLVATDLSGDLVDLRVYDMSTGQPTLVQSVTDIGGTMSALTVDGLWTIDAEGYNFKHTFDGSTALKGGKTYNLEYTLNTDSLGPIYVVTTVRVVALSSV